MPDSPDLTETDGGWRPPDTAPRLGSTIEVRDRQGRTFHAVWDVAHGVWLAHGAAAVEADLDGWRPLPRVR